MEVEKKRSKGGFLNLFDWNGKSRKKLFSNHSEELPGSKQEKEDRDIGENLSQTEANRVKVDEDEASLSTKGINDWNSASWVTSDEGAKAPGVVARLMGLDTLPTKNSTEPSPSSTPYFESFSVGASNYHKSTPNLWNDFYAMEGINMPNGGERLSRNPVESRSQRLQNRSIERFQTEVLPPKSAKSIPATHHKLLSPIKNPGFVATKNAAYIVEAAAKMTEASPRASARNKVSSIGSSSVPLRIRDLKEKMEAVNKASRPEKPKEARGLKHTKRQYSTKSPNGSEYVLVTRASTNSEKPSVNNTRDRGSSVSLAVQAKTNIQRRDGSSSTGNRRSFNHKEQKEAKSNHFTKFQPNVQRSEQKRASVESSNNVLRQNNQKQNCVSTKDKSIAKTLISNQPARRTRSSNGSVEPNKNGNKVAGSSKTGSRKLGSARTATQRDISLPASKIVSQRKRSVCQEAHSEETVTNNTVISEDERSIKCNIATDSSSNMGADIRKQGMDVISFTFTSPLKRSISESQLSGQDKIMEKRFGINFVSDKDQQLYSKNFSLSSPGLDLMGGDSLSILLEQKLQELACKVQSSKLNLLKEGSSASSMSRLQDSGSSSVSTTSRIEQFQLDQHGDKMYSSYDYNDGPVVDLNQKWKELEEMEECSGSSNIIETEEESESQDLSLLLDSEPSFESGSCAESRSSANGSKKCSVVQSQFIHSYKNEFLPAYDVTDSPESTSSSSTRDVDGKRMPRRMSLTDLDKQSNWELEYVRNILSNAELALENFAFDDADKVIAPNLFDRMENEENGRETNGEDCSKLGRKVLFDCVKESLDSRCGQMFVGSCSRLARLCPRKEWLAEELCDEISVWKSMSDLMLDELVDMEMSTRRGRWLEFDNEAFEEGVEIEKVILTSLINEFIVDLMVF
ncbi:hypothetical protein UlMin_029088 [Ulmus minor]